MPRAPRGSVVVAAVLGSLAWTEPAVHGDPVAGASSDAFSCIAEARALVQEHSAGEIRAERDRRLAEPSEPDEPAVVTAHRWCVVAELMRSLGDDEAARYYARAIAATGDPGYELRFGDYFRTVRGPRAALSDEAERHYLAALGGVRAHVAGPAASDDAIAESASRGLLLTFEQDGLPVLPWRPARSGSISPWPRIAVMVGARLGFDTNDTPVDAGSPAQVDDARRFTSEALFAASSLRKAQPLRDDELQAIARAPLRTELMARGRLRWWPLGAIDLWARQSQVYGGEITSYQQPLVMNDITASELGAGLSRALDLSPAFDLLLAGDYRRVHRTGVVEFAPGQEQDFNAFAVRPTVARFLGPDKLSLSAGYTIIAVPDVVGGVLAERARGRAIGALDIDYAMNRLVLPPLQLPASHVFAGIAWDDETFGVRTVRRRDAYVGVGMAGFRRWDVTIQSSVFSGAVAVQPQDAARAAAEDPQQDNAQYRTTVVLARRVIDADAQPALSREAQGPRVAMLHAVVTVRHDLALRGLAAYENVRGGVELRAKLLVGGLRDTAVLLSTGYDNQYFGNIGKDLHVGHVDVRMGW